MPRGTRPNATWQVEQIAPFPYDLIASALARFPKAELVWVQEEPLNAGAWSYVKPRIEMVAAQEAETATLETGGTDQQADQRALTLQYVGRRPSAAPATGLRELHLMELRELLREAME